MSKYFFNLHAAIVATCLCAQIVFSLLSNSIPLKMPGGCITIGVISWVCFYLFFMAMIALHRIFLQAVPDMRRVYFIIVRFRNPWSSDFAAMRFDDSIYLDLIGWPCVILACLSAVIASCVYHSFGVAAAFAYLTVVISVFYIKHVLPVVGVRELLRWILNQHAAIVATCLSAQIVFTLMSNSIPLKMPGGWITIGVISWVFVYLVLMVVLLMFYKIPSLDLKPPYINPDLPPKIKPIFYLGHITRRFEIIGWPLFIVALLSIMLRCLAYHLFGVAAAFAYLTIIVSNFYVKQIWRSNAHDGRRPDESLTVSTNQQTKSPYLTALDSQKKFGK